jgi:hypothetical protein
VVTATTSAGYKPKGCWVVMEVNPGKCLYFKILELQIAECRIWTKNVGIAEGSKLHLEDQMNLQIRADILDAFQSPGWDEGYNNDPTSIDWGLLEKDPTSLPTLHGVFNCHLG